MVANTSPLRISKDSQKAILNYYTGLMTERAAFSEIYSKMEAIDQAYARYKAKDASCGTTNCDVFASDDVTAPIVVSQVDSMVGYLAEIFLSGYPLFPVVSTPAKRKYAEQLETLLDDHAILGGYARQLLLFFRDGTKYNYAALEANWSMIQQFSVLEDWTAEDNKKLNRNSKFFTEITRLDPYNTFCDRTVPLGDVSRKGDYAGYLEILSRTKLKTLLNKYSQTREVYNAAEAINASESGAPYSHYQMHPTISNYVSARLPRDGVDWERYFIGTPSAKLRGVNNYEIGTVYARILPSEFGISGPQPNTPQIWKFVIVNGSVMIHAKRIISAYDYLPILFAQPLEDGLGYQTQSVAEGSIPFQESASTLFNIRFSGARRAVADRALYDPNMISPSDVNSPVAAPKIPVTIRPLENKGLESAYRQIPFDTRGTETALHDAALIVDFSKQLSGLNNAQQGQFQPGNKSVQEFQSIMGGADARLRLPAITIEHQAISPLKQILALNIFQYGEDTIVVSQKTGEVLDINIEELRKEVLAFRIADGYTPKSKLASTDMLVQGLNVIMNSPALQQAYGASLPAMFAHMMQLGGVRGLDQYAPEIQPQAGELPNQIQEPINGNLPAQ